MENDYLIKKYGKHEYDQAREDVKKLINIGLERKQIEEAATEGNINSLNVLDDKEKLELIEYIYRIKEGIIIHNDGFIITSGGKGKYEVPTETNSAWMNFREKLYNKTSEGKRIYTSEEIDALGTSTIKIINNLSQKRNEDGTSTKGMVVGYVQSGKTTSIESLISIAADCGWNTFIMLSGTIENLRVQNANRLRDDIEYAKAGVVNWKFNPDLNSDKYEGLLNSNRKVVIVCLKNSTRLKNLKKWLISAGNVALKKAKILLIDDEADQASLNTYKKDKQERTRINNTITSLIDDYNDVFGAMNYIGYTATPYGNFLNELESVYPKDFIYMLNKSNKYIGPQEIFGYESLDNGKEIKGLNIVNDITDDELEDIKEIEEGNMAKMPNSLKESICWFICCLAMFRHNNNKNPVSMLIHTNRKTNMHENIYNYIHNWFKTNKSIIEKCEKVYNSQTNRLDAKKFKNVLNEYDLPIENYPSFNEIKPYIEEILSSRIGFAKIDDDKKIQYTKGIHFVIDNCKSNMLTAENEYARLVYPEKDDNIDYSTGFIVIGGDTLSRGLTIKGLVSTYFTRKSNQADTLMQMGRWFGYRTGYELLPRIWLDETNKTKFKEITNIEYNLRKDLEKYEIGESPIACGPYIKLANLKSNLLITAKNKSKEMIEINVDYRGVNPQTTYFDNDKEIQNKNEKLTKEFLQRIGNFKESYNNKNNLLAEDIDFNIISDYLKKFKFCAQTAFFNNIKSFCEWVDNNQFDKWNVVVSGLANDSIGKWEFGKYSINKASRSKIKNQIDDYFNIKILRDPSDLICDVKDIDVKQYKSVKSKLDRRSKYNKALLILYVLDGTAKIDNLDSNRENINLNSNIIGLYIFIPGLPGDNKNRTVTIRIAGD